MNLKEIKEILEMMETYGISEFELEKNGIKLKLGKGGSSAGVAAIPHGFTGHSMQMPMTASTAPAVGQDDPNVIIVRSPMVGTFYAAPAPDKDSYVHKNQDVKVDDVLCIVEAMKLMNEIKSELSGKVVEILVNNGEAVEFDQPLFKILKK